MLRVGFISVFFSHPLRRDDGSPSLISKEAYRTLCETILDFYVYRYYLVVWTIMLHKWR